jgi:hypothetical protein
VPESFLRIAIVIDGLVQPAWICRVIDFVRAHHRLAAFTIVPSSNAPRGVAERLFRLVDDRLFSRTADGFTSCDVSKQLDGVARELSPTNLDLVLAFASQPQTAIETWSVDLDGWNEFVARKPFTEAILKSRGKVIARTTGMTDGISFRRAFARLGMRAAAMIEAELDRRARGSDAPPQRITHRQAAQPPRFGGSAITAFSSARGWIAKWLRERRTRRQWGLAVSFDPNTHADFAQFHPITPPPDRIWADPFVIADGERVWIFIEEMEFTTDRGVLAVMEVHRDGTWSAPQRVLERDFHLSYPCVFRWNGELFMVPDTRFNRTIELYRCTQMPDRWELDTVLMTEIDAVDTTVFKHDRRWWMYFTTPSGDRAGLDRLWLHHADSPRGPWMPHRWNPLECDVVGGRCGGRPFMRDGKLLRAVQIGTPYYGYALGLREIVTLTPDAWEERLVETILPNWSADLAGMHTLNVDGDVAVVDVMRFRSG